MNKIYIKTIAVAAVMLGACSNLALGATYHEQDFDSWPEQTSWGEHTFNQWLVSNGVVRTYDPFGGWSFYPHSGTQEAGLNGDAATKRSSVTTPLMTNGAGKVSFYYAFSETGVASFEVQSTTNGGASWITHTSVTDTNVSHTAYKYYSTTLDIYEDAQVRIEKTADDPSTLYLLIDDVFITLPPAYADISDVQLAPTPQLTETPVKVSAKIEPKVFGSNIEARVYYSTNNWSTSASTPMTETGSSYYVSSPDIPEMEKPGLTVQYYIDVTLDGPTTNNTHSYWPEGAPSTTASYLLRAKPFSTSYGSMTVTGGPPTTSMLLQSDYVWRGVTEQGSFASPSFNFESGATTWGDTDQSGTTLPLSGIAETSGTIDLTETVTSHMVFTFNEASTNTEYSIQPCEYVSFDDWTSATTFSSYTNSEQWSMYNARTTDSSETNKAFTGSGLSAVLKGASTGSLRTPYLSAGIGALSFRMRNWLDDGSAPVNISIEKSSDGTSWLPVTSYDAILTPDYIFITLNIADDANHYVQLLNTSSNSTDYLCLDNVSVTPPGALVKLSNPTINPASPSYSPLPVNVTIDFTASGGATNLEGRIYWKAPDSVDYDWAAMSAAGSTFYGEIPPTLAGSVYYYFECLYEGFNAAPAAYPNGGAAAPLSFTASSNTPSYRTQDFDSWPEQTSWGEHTFNDWLVSNGVVRTYDPFGNWPNYPHSGTQAAGLNAPASTERSSVRSPLLTNGAGNVSFYYAFSQNGVASFEVQYSTNNGASWITHSSVTDTNVDKTAYKFFTTDMDVNDDAYVRIEKTADDSSTLYLLIDDVICAPPSADVIITNVFFSPGYPGTADTVTVSCDIYPANLLFKSFDYRPKLCYRPANGSWTTNSMSRSGSNTWQALIPPQNPDTVEYFFRCDFAGYYYTNGTISTTRSPAFLPDAPATTNMPSTYFEYVPRRYLSEHDSLSVSSSVGNATMSLIGDKTWQGVFEAPSSTQMLFKFQASGYYDGTGIDSTTNSFGDDSQQFSEPPFSGYASDSSTTDIVLNVDTSSMSQIVFFFNPNTGYYEVRRGAYENFDNWRADPNYFANSLNIADIIVITNNFNSLSTNAVVVRPAPYGNGQANFEDPDWPLSPTYVTGPEGPLDYDLDDGYFVERYRIAGEVDNHALALSPVEDNGATWPDVSVLTDGLGKLEWKARCRFEDDYDTWYTNGLAWTNYAVSATLYGRNGAGWPKMSLLAYYQNPSNYYVCHIQGTNSDINGNARFDLGIYRVLDGTPARLTSQTVTKSVSNSMHVTFRAATGVNRIRLEATTSVGGSRSYNDSNMTLKDGGTIGLKTDDIRMIADNIGVSNYFYCSFDGWNTAWTPSADTNLWHLENFQGRDNSCYLSNNLTGVIESPYMITPATRMQIRHYYYNDGGPASSSFNVQGSIDGSSWSDIQTVTTTNTWRTADITSGFGTYNYLRIRNNASGDAGRIRFDWLWIQNNSTSFYTEDFSDGVADNWINESGYWYVDPSTFNYQRQAYCGPTLGFKIDANTNYNVANYPNSGWTNVANYTISNNLYQTFSLDFHYWDKLFTRVSHTTGEASLRLDDITMSSWRAHDFESNGWAVTEGWVAKAGDGSNQIELWRSRANPTNAQAVRSPHMTNGVGSIEFDYDFEGLNGSNATFNIEWDYLTNGSWIVTNTYTVTPSDDLPGKVYFDFSTSEQIYVRVRHTTSNNTAIMKIDNLEITDYKERDDRTWEAYNAKITSLEDTREFEPFYTPESDVKTAYLNSSPNLNTLNGATYSNSYPFIQSAKVKEGIGRVSFWYRAWENDGDPAGKITLYASASETAAMSNWTPLASFSADNTEYKFYQNDFYELDKYFLRVTSGTNGSGRVCIDNMLVAQPLAADFEIENIEITPSVPLDTDSVNVAVDIGRFVLDPTNIQAKVYYKIGTNDWGNTGNTWDTNTYYLPMEPVDWANSLPTRFESVSNIPPQNIDTVVQYYVEFTFTGTFANVTSPKKGRTFTNPAWYSNINLNVVAPITNPYYIVYSCPPDTVWINEFNYHYSFVGGDNEFVEIAGQSGSDVNNWRVELLKSDYSVYGSYPITNITILPNDTGSGFGFWLLGDAELGASVDATFTNTADGTYHMADPGAIRLVRGSGIWEDFISYGALGSAMTGTLYSSAKTDAFNDGTIRLTGTGETVNAFSWQYAPTLTATLNEENQGQTMELATPPPPTYTITISNFWTTASNTYIVTVSDHSNQITVTPWYCTNLINTNWQEVTVYYQAYAPSSGIYTQYFDNVTNIPPVYFRVTSTNDP